MLFRLLHLALLTLSPATLSNSACPGFLQGDGNNHHTNQASSPNQGDAAATGTDPAANGVRSGAIAVPAVLAAKRANTNDAAQDILGPLIERGDGNDGLAVVFPVQDSQDHCHRCCCHRCHSHCCCHCWYGACLRGLKICIK